MLIKNRNISPKQVRPNTSTFKWRQYACYRFLRRIAGPHIESEGVSVLKKQYLMYFDKLKVLDVSLLVQMRDNLEKRTVDISTAFRIMDHLTNTYNRNQMTVIGMSRKIGSRVCIL